MRSTVRSAGRAKLEVCQVSVAAPASTAALPDVEAEGKVLVLGEPQEMIAETAMTDASGRR
jgi:hypothetical protein